MKCSYILFEGGTCVGKTTHAKNISNRLKNNGSRIIYKKSSPSENFLGRVILSMRKRRIPEIINDVLYNIDALIDGIEIRVDLSKGNTVVQDKSIYSTKSFYEAYRQGFKKHFNNGMMFFVEKIYPKPDIIFLLKTDYNIRVDRKEQKSSLNSIDDYMLNSKNRCYLIDESLERSIRNYPKIDVDTSDASVEDIDSHIMKYICD